MDIYLHIGTNKTGSSFIQTSLALNKKKLENDGIYLPSSCWDKEMKEGEITPGNGHQLARLLATEDKIGLKKYLSTLVKQAKYLRCNKLVLSNEVIIRLFSNPDLIALLENTASQVGIEKINCLCFLRNPYEHALSLYKHRAKGGQYLDYKDWFETDYETLRLFKEFLKHYTNCNFVWSFVRYQKDSVFLLQQVYQSFLKVKVPEQGKKDMAKKINPSLSLNHIRMIQWFESMYTGIASYLHKELIKEESFNLENYTLKSRFIEIGDSYFQHYRQELISLKELLPINDRQIFMDKPVIKVISEEFEILLNAKEILVFTHAVNNYRKNRLKDILKLFYRWIRKKIQILKPKSFDSKRYGGSLR